MTTKNYYGKTSVVEALQNLLGKDTQVSYEEGAGFTDAYDAHAVEQAVELAKHSDVVILCLGTNLHVEAEGRDRRNLDLPGAQEQLLEAVYAANPRTVLVLMTAGPLAVTWAQDHLPAIMSAWYPGESGGTAIARALFGLDNPGGHLPYTVYSSLDGVPPQNEYDVSKGFTYQYFKGIPLYAFGFGLSYTKFEFTHLQIKPPALRPTKEIEISFDVRNSGDRAGSEVAQVYTHQEKSAVYQPIRSLRGFRRIQLQPGESKSVQLRIPASELAHYDAAKHAFVVDPGLYDVQVSAASDDIRLRGTLEISSPVK